MSTQPLPARWRGSISPARRRPTMLKLGCAAGVKAAFGAGCPGSLLTAKRELRERCSWLSPPAFCFSRSRGNKASVITQLHCNGTGAGALGAALVPAARGTRSKAGGRIGTAVAGMAQGLESRLVRGEVNLYSLEEAQGETRPGSINTRSNRNQGRKLFRRREDKEQRLKQKQEKFTLGLARKEKSRQHRAETGYQATRPPLRAPHPLWKPHKGLFFSLLRSSASVYGSPTSFLPCQPFSQGRVAPSRPGMP